MISERRMCVLVQAAQFEDISLCEGFRNEEEREFYEGNVKWFNELREQNGGTLEGLDIDIPYSFDDDDDS